MSEYEKKLFYQFYGWADRLRVGLEGAIIKLSANLREALLV